jgi:nucleoside-diphosphate-sugar epimerase
MTTLKSGTAREGELSCVTGGSGFIGTHVVRELLERGYRVRATVRDPEDTKKCGHLRSLPFAGERLEVLRGDLMDSSSFDDAFVGCKQVYHTASPVYMTAKNPQEDIVDPAIAGTRNVMAAIERAGTVRRVGLTSSVAAVVSTGRRPEHTFTEEDWNDDATVKTNPYGLSKTLSERSAWAFRDALPEERRFGMVVVNPVYVLGPVYAPIHLRTSPSIVRDALVGTYPGNVPICFPIVDVRDVVETLIDGVENPKLNERYILHSESLWMYEMAEIVQRHFPELRIKTHKFPGILMYLAPLMDKRLSLAFVRTFLNRRDRLSNAKLKMDFGRELRSAEQSILDTCESMLALELVEPKRRR